jgi:hypothetical protein
MVIRPYKPRDSARLALLDSYLLSLRAVGRVPPPSAAMGGALSKRVERAEKTGVIALRDELC